MKPHLIVVGPLPPPINGESIALDQLIHSDAVQKNYQIDVVNMSRNKGTKGGHFSFLKIVQDIKSILTIYRKVKKNRNGLLYLSISQTKLGLFRDAIIIGLSYGKVDRIIAHLHGNNLKNVLLSLKPILAKKIFSTLKKIDTGIVLNNTLATNFMALPKRVVVVANGIDQNLFSSKEIDSAALRRRKNNTFHILYLSNLIESKGFGELILAVMDLLKRNVDVTLTLAGQLFDRPLFEELFQEIEQCNWESRINYLGVVTGDEKKRLLLETDLMILPTRYPIEGQPISIIEGMAAGLPIISTTQGAIPDMIDGSGIIVDHVDRESLAHAIKQLIDDQTLYARLSEHSRASFLKHFTLDHYINELISVFERGISNEQKNYICH